MDKAVYESYYLSDQEFYILLAHIGMDTWYGFGYDFEAVFPRSEPELNRILATLYCRGIITRMGDTIEICEPYRAIFEILKYTDQCILSKHAWERENIRCQYFGKFWAVIVERSFREERHLKITRMRVEDWLELLQEEGWFPEVLQEPGHVPDKRYLAFKPEYSIFDYCAKADVVSVFESRNIVDGALKRRVIVQDVGVCGYLYIQSAGECRLETASKKAWRHLLYDWIDGRQGR